MKGFAPGWFARCTICGWTVPAEDLGMIRIGAASSGKRVFAHCPKCDKRRWLAVLAGESEADLPPFDHSIDPATREKAQRRLLLKLIPVIAIVVVLFFGGLFGGLGYYFHQHALTEKGKLIVEQSREAKAVLGEPIRFGWLIGGSVRNNDANITFPVSGSTKAGTVTVVGTFVADRWVLRRCTLEIDDGSTLELSAESP